MKKAIPLFLAILFVGNMACQAQDQFIKKSPTEVLNDAYQLFKESKDKESIELATAVLEYGKSIKNDTLVGKALTSLCRNAQRTLDTATLASLSQQLQEVATRTGEQKWLMYRAHQNAEMWRLVGNMDRADSFYVESMRISKAINAKGMYMIDHFNKSFVATAKGNYEEANDLIKKYYELRKEANLDTEDAYGLIALAYLLEQQKNYSGAHKVALVTRRIFKMQNIFPEPPDEKPLLSVEAKVKEVLPKTTLEEINKLSTVSTVSSLLDEYLK